MQPVGTLLAYLGIANSHVQVFVADLDHGTQNQLTSGSLDHGSLNCFPAGDRILYSEFGPNGNSIRLADWDGRDVVTLAEGGEQDYVLPVLSPDVSQVAYFSTRNGYWALFVMSVAGGSGRPITDNTVFESVASWSPDGFRIAFTPWHNTESPSFIGAVGADGRAYIELTTPEEWDSDPVWAPDGTSILFNCGIDGLPQICSVRPDGSARRQLTYRPGGNSNPVWSPDGELVAFVSWRDGEDPDHCQDGDCNFEIYVMAADGSAQTRVTDNPFEDWSPSWSPNGSMIAFVSLRDEPLHPSICGDTCNSEIYVMDRSGANVRRVTDNGEPDWSPTWRPTR